MRDSLPFDFIKADGCQVFLHTTSIENAKKILEEGFMFPNIDIFKTVDPVNSQPQDFDFIVGYLLGGRRAYGDAVVVIHIGQNLLKKYGGRWQEHLSEDVPDYDEDQFVEVDCVVKLDNQFIKGYFNRETGECFENPNYNPILDKPEFKK